MADSNDKEKFSQKKITNNGADAVYIKSMSVLQAAEYLHCTLPTARILLKQGKIKGQKIHGKWYIDVQSVEEYAKQAIYMSTEIEINGERARQISDIARGRRRDRSYFSKAIHDGKLNGHFINGKWYVTDSEMEYFDKVVSKPYKPYLSIGQAAARLGTNAEHLHTMIIHKQIKCFTLNKRRYIYEEDIEKYMESTEWRNPFDFKLSDVRKHKAKRENKPVFKAKKQPNKIIPNTFRRKNND